MVSRCETRNAVLYSRKRLQCGRVEIIAPTVKHFANVCATKDNKTVGIRFRNPEFVATKGDYASVSTLLSSDTVEQKCTEYASAAQSCFAAHGAIRFENAEACSVDNCKITCAGVHAIETNKGCCNVRVEECRISNCGVGGIKIFGSECEEDDLRPTRGNTVRRNIISDCGKRWAADCGILVCHSSQNEISENNISNLVVGYGDIRPLLRTEIL